jgi:hypothetical protein
VLSLNSKAIVVGFSGGIAENIAYKLSKEGMSVVSVLDNVPLSPSLREIALGKSSTAELSIYTGDFLGNIESLSLYKGDNKRTTSLDSILSSESNLLIAALDTGISDISFERAIDKEKVETEKRKMVNTLLSIFSKSISSNTKGIMCALSAENNGQSSNAISKLFASNDAEILSSIAAKRGIPLSLFRLFFN